PSGPTAGRSPCLRTFARDSRRSPADMRRLPAIAFVVLAALAPAGCLYHLNGGGLPSDIKSVAVIPFDNETASPELQRELNVALRSNLASKLGLKEASEDKASAVVRGKIVNYDLDVATAFSANP